MINNIRINWIDWAKCIAITMVVFGHIPQPKGSFLQFYICTFHIPLFFFISGYLTKARPTLMEELTKCWHSLIIPYFLYHIIFYPYWAIRLYIDSGIDFTVFDYVIKPIIGLIFLQIETPISSPVNGAMWFIAVLVIMRLIAHACNRQKNTDLYMIISAVFFWVLYIYTRHEDILRSTTIEGLLLCTPLFLLGNITKRHQWIDKVSLKSDTCWAFLLIGISVLVSFAYANPTSFSIQMISLFIVMITASYGILFLCKVLNNISFSVIRNISIGTLMIMGLHWMFIGTTNFTIERSFSFNNGIQYSWYISIIFAICIDAAIYPIIIFSKKHFPILIGK